MSYDYDFNHLTNGYLGDGGEGGQDGWREWGTRLIWIITGDEDKYNSHSFAQINTTGCRKKLLEKIIIPDIIYFRFSLSIYNGSGTGSRFLAQLRRRSLGHDGVRPIVGLRVDANYDLYMSTSTYGFAYSGTPTGLTNGQFYEISFLYNTLTKTYFNILYAGQSMGNVVATDLDVSDVIGCMAFQRCNLWYSDNIMSFDNIHIDGYNINNKYLHYPRWQPTKHGMRPFY